MKEYKLKINGNDYNVAINSTKGNIADVTVNTRTVCSHKILMISYEGIEPLGHRDRRLAGCHIEEAVIESYSKDCSV